MTVTNNEEQEGDQQFSMVTGQNNHQELDASMLPVEQPPQSPDQASENLFMGQKERRKSSSAKLHLGDYLALSSSNNSNNSAIINAAGNPGSVINSNNNNNNNGDQIRKIMAKNGDSQILFSDIVIKINKRNKMQERILLLTDMAVYNIDPSNCKVKRRISLHEVGSISLSRLPDNFFCVHVPSEYDYLLVSNKKSEIVSKMCEAYRRATGCELAVHFANTFEYKIDDNVYREILFSNVEGGISTQIFTKKKHK